MKRKRRRHSGERNPQPNSKLFFSLPTVRILKDALCFFESFLNGKSDTLPNIPFAKEVVAELKRKLSEMLEREEWNKDTPLDYNEIHLLHTSCAMYLIELAYLHKADLLPPCIALCKQLAIVVEQAEKDVAQEKRKR